MDHKGFDDRMRNKLSGLNPKFKPDSWDDMVDMLRFSTFSPWYIRWQKALWGTGLLLFSLLNLYLLWEIKSSQNMPANVPVPVQEKIVVVDTVKVIDTVFITKTVYAADPAPNGSMLPTSTLPATAYTTPGAFGLPASPGQNMLAHPLSRTNLTASSENDLLTDYYHNSKKTGETTNLLSTDYYHYSNKPVETIPFLVPEPAGPEEWFEDYTDQFEIRETVPSGKRNRRKHRSNPFQARIGLTAGLLIPNPDIGERYISQRLGVTGEFSIKKNLRFLTGAHYNKITYKLDEVDDDNFDAEDLERLPGYAELASVPDEVVIENEIIQMPLHLRIYKNLNYNWSVFVSGGPTIDFLLNQSFNYEYLEIDNDALIEFNEVTREKDLRIYLGNFTGSFGIEHNFSRKLAGQMNVDYQYGLSRLGVERRSVNALSLNLAAFYKLN